VRLGGCAAISHRTLFHPALVAATAAACAAPSITMLARRRRRVTLPAQCTNGRRSRSGTALFSQVCAPKIIDAQTIVCLRYPVCDSLTVWVNVVVYAGQGIECWMGCSPCSWLLYIARCVGPTGRVLGLDIAQPSVAVDLKYVFRAVIRPFIIVYTACSAIAACAQAVTWVRCNDQAPSQR